MNSGLEKLPPLTVLRLLAGLALLAAGWLGWWVKWHHDIEISAYGIIFSFFCVLWVTGIFSWQPKGDMKPIHSVLIITSFMAFLALLWFDWDLPAWARPALSHPAVFIAAWAITSGLLVWHWWKRRNNTPHLSDEWKPHSR